MSTNIRKKPESSSNIRVKEIQLKQTHHSVNHLFSPKKLSNSHIIKKNTFTQIHSAQKDKNQYHKESSVTPKSKERVEFQTTYGSFSINKLGSIPNSVKNTTKQIIHYSANINQNKAQLNNESLYTIHEQMMKISTRFLNKSGTNNNFSKNIPNIGLATEASLSSSSKLFHTKKVIYPLNTTGNIKKSIKKDVLLKNKPIYQHSHTNTESNMNQLGNNVKQRNDRYIGTQENKSPKRYLSLSKVNEKNVSKNRYHNQTNEKNNRGYNNTLYNVIKKTKERIKESISKQSDKLSIIKANNLNKNLFGNIKYSKSVKKEISIPTTKNNSNTNTNTNTNTSSTTTNIARTQINRSNSKEYQMTHTAKNSFIINKQAMPLLDSSGDHLDPKEKAKITVNRKKTTSSSSSFWVNSSELINKYSSYLTQAEVEELRVFPFNIYYIRPFEIRITNRIKYDNEINSTYSYIHFPDFNYETNTLPKSKSFKSFKDLTVISECYNDEENNYILNSGDHLLYRYEIIELLGKGSFGEAVKCIDHKTNEIVCVKIIKSYPKFALQALIEIKILEHIKQNDQDNYSNIVQFYSQFIFRNHICLVFELLDINLYDHIKMNDYTGFDMRKIKLFAIELLFTLLFLKKQKILHCDLKPENILLMNKGKSNHVKVIDFGSSCFDQEKLYTYIQSRFYRAPEIILDQGYSYEIDMWSLGCILPELYTGIPIFPGEEERDQMMYIMEYLGVPSNDYIDLSKKKRIFFDDNYQPFLLPTSEGNIRQPQSKLISYFLKGTTELFQDFIRKCLTYYPQERLTPEQGLLHGWIIKDMSSEALFLHKQKIKKIRLCQIHQLSSVPSTIRPMRNNYKRLSSQSQNSQHSMHHIKTALFNKTPNKSPSSKRHPSKEVLPTPLLLKNSIKKIRKSHLLIETPYDIKKKKESSVKLKSNSYLESMENQGLSNHIINHYQI